MTRAVLVLLGLLSSGLSVAQVSNDKVANRIRLEPDGPPLRTTTTGSTVERDCLNEALTNKCLVYHNDQWYTFQVKEPQAYFLNISSLVCRNANGIQVILIEGNPCETKNYRVIQCIRQIKNEEVFIPLGMVVADTPYLIEIDGFDGDQCDFDIQIARRASGVPLKHGDLLQSEYVISSRTQTDSLVSIGWKVPAGWLEQIDQFRVYRLEEGAMSRLERSLPQTKNAYGKPSDSYAILDTLTSAGIYLYRVLGYPQTGAPILLSEARVMYAKKEKKPPLSQSIVIKPQFTQKVDYVLRVYESEQLSILHALNGTYDPAKPEPITIDMRESIANGHKGFMVLLINKVTRESMEFYFRVDGRGAVVAE